MVNEAIKKMVKCAEITMQNSLLLQQQIHQLESENQHKRKRKGRTKHFIQNGGSLTFAEVRKQEEEQKRELERNAQPKPPRPHRPQKCSNCAVLGHNRHVCSSR